ncbi:MAG: N-acylneuraminate cytidylyltransferase [Salibacteraceae bacterium]
MKNICIIPARGGSKRIPRKNIKLFLGKPIIAYSIESAIKSNLFEKVIVSTDDNEIAEISKEFGAEVPFLRSISNADDHATLNDVLVEVKTQLKGQGEYFDNYCVLLPTAPLISAELLKSGFDFLIRSKFDSIRPIVRFNYPIQRAQTLKDGRVSFMYQEFANTRSQDLEPAFHDAGMFYFVRELAPLSSGKKGGFEIEAKFAQDIDTLEDWEMAEIKFQIINKK